MTNNEEKKNKNTTVNVEFPSELNIRLVQANEFKHYEIFLWLAGVLTTVSCGFWVSFFTLIFSKPILFSAIAFSILSLVLGRLAYITRKKALTNGVIKKSISLSVFRSDINQEKKQKNYYKEAKQKVEELIENK
jgi:heme exporter protein D